MKQIYPLTSVLGFPIPSTELTISFPIIIIDTDVPHHQVPI